MGRAADLATAALSAPALTDDDERTARAALDDPDPRVRAAAAGALVRAGSPSALGDHWSRATFDAHVIVRRRAAELSPLVVQRSRGAGRRVRVEPRLVELLADDPEVAETAAWALGETAPDADDPGVVSALAVAARTHADALVREAAVAALGAIGDPRGLDAVLAACEDTIAIRRRAVLALAPFTGPTVDAALARAQADRDWQVRQAAEDLDP